MKFDDGAVRPVVDGAVVGPDGSSETSPFLIDTGADSTVLNYEAVAFLAAEGELTEGPSLDGIGGSSRSVIVPTRVWVLNSAGFPTPLRGRLLGRVDPAGDKFCILGRDLLNNFAVIVDRQGGAVALLAPPHRYVIHGS